MSRKKLIESMVSKLIQVAETRGFIVNHIHDGEEGRNVLQDELRSHVIRDITATDMARVRFTDCNGTRFFVGLIFENQPSEMIWDHTDNEAARIVCNDVCKYFEARGQ